MADALLNGKAMKIEGGHIELAIRRFRCAEDGYEWDLPDDRQAAGPPLCPHCHRPNATPCIRAGPARDAAGAGQAASCRRRRPQEEAGGESG